MAKFRTAAKFTPPPGATKGRIVVDPATGDRRIRLSDIAAPNREDEVELSLYDILRGEVRAKSGPHKFVRLKPLTLNGLAVLQEAFKDRGGLESLAKRVAPADVITIATVLANDNEPPERQLTEEQVGKMLNASQLPAILQLINEVLAGPLVAAGGQAPAAAETEPRPVDGRGSSSGARRSSAGALSGSAGSASRTR